MNASELSAAVYALQENRHNGRPPRIVYRSSDPDDIRRAADLLKWAGQPVEIVVLAAGRDDE